MVAPKLDNKQPSEAVPDVQVVMKKDQCPLKDLPEPPHQPWTWKALVVPYAGFLCCQVVGFPALIASMMSYIDYRSGNNDSRFKKQRLANRLGIAAMILGTIFTILILGLWCMPLVKMTHKREIPIDDTPLPPHAVPQTHPETHENIYYAAACENSNIHPICPNKKERLFIVSVTYGRMNGRMCTKGRPADQIKNQNCNAKYSLQVLKDKCDHRRECHVQASNSVFGDPCVGTFKYLEVRFKCVIPEQDGVLNTPQPVARGRQFFGMACERERLQLVCPVGQSINVLTATYGRTDPDYCPDGPIRTTSCHAKTSDYEVRSRCDGKQRCTIEAVNSVFTDPCEGTFKYLKVRYNCLVVHI